MWNPHNIMLHAALFQRYIVFADDVCGRQEQVIAALVRLVHDSAVTTRAFWMARVYACCAGLLSRAVLPNDTAECLGASLPL